MNLLHAWYLILNATNNSHVANLDVCNGDSKLYDVWACHEYVVGIPQEKLRIWALNETKKHEFFDDKETCDHSFYVHGFNEFEDMFPQFRGCYISTYAAVVQAVALGSPCRTTNKSAAKFLMAPPYSAHECNWPAYGKFWCNGRANNIRKGRRCGKSIHDAADKMYQLSGKQVLLVEQAAGIPYEYPAKYYQYPGVVLAKVNSLDSRFRPNLDVSMPPASFPRCWETPAKAYDEPLKSKKYFVGFKGQMHTPIRRELRALLHNGADRLVLANNDTEYDFDALLQQSRFNLVLPGDQEFSYRFNEAVCSGGVPVLIGKHWIPPFSEFLAIEKYAVRIHLKNRTKALDILRAIPDDKVQQLRVGARIACNHMFRNVPFQMRSLLKGLLARA